MKCSAGRGVALDSNNFVPFFGVCAGGRSLSVRKSYMRVERRSPSRLESGKRSRAARASDRRTCSAQLPDKCASIHRWLQYVAQCRLAEMKRGRTTLWGLLLGASIAFSGCGSDAHNTEAPEAGGDAGSDIDAADST